MRQQLKQGLKVKDTHHFIDVLYDGDIHVKRVESLANATIGVISSGSMAVNTIGQGLAWANGKVTKHSIKQVDRLLSNAGIDMDEFFEHWVPYMIGQKPHICVAMDWTDCDADDQSTLMLSLITKHGRATPVCTENLNPNVLTMKSAHYGARIYDAGSLNLARDRRILVQ